MSQFCTNLEGNTKSENGILSKATKILYLLNAKRGTEGTEKDVQVSVEERDVQVQADTSTVSALIDSNTTVPEMKSTGGVMDVF